MVRILFSIALWALATLIFPSIRSIAAGEKPSTPNQDGVSRNTKVEGLVVNVDNEPIGDARITCLGYFGNKANAFEAIVVRSDANGRFQATVPSKVFRVHVGSPSDEYDSNRGFGVNNGQALTPWDGVESRPARGKVSVVVTLPQAYDLRFELIDAETGRPVQEAAVLYKDDEVFWHGEGDYDTEASWYVYRVFENYLPTFKKRTSGNMRLAHILVLATGYEPVRVKLNEELTRGKPISKRVEMKPLALVELTIVTPDGKSAVGASIETIQPEEFQAIFRYKGGPGLKRLLDIEQTSDDRGIVGIHYPAFGDWAVYRIMHPSGYVKFRVEDLPSAIDADTTNQVRKELAPYGTIRGRYLPEVAANEYLEAYRLKPTRMSVDAPSVRVELDENGRFELGPRLAGWHSFAHRVRYSHRDGGTGTSAVAVYGPFRLTNGQTIDLTLGDEGQPVTGRLVLPDGWDHEKQLITISVDSGTFPCRPHAPAHIDDHVALLAWWNAYWQSDKGRQYRHHKRHWGTTVAGPDGEFRFAMLRPGNYRLRLSQRNQDRPRLKLAKTEFEIPEARRTEPFDLGDLQLKK